MSEVAQLSILLGAVPVGTLTLQRDEISEFEFLESYRGLSRRPVLGQAFEDDLSKKHRSRMALPPFFANLLPEGRLREVVARRLQVSAAREFPLLARLGADLPGAVRAVPSEELIEEPDSPAELTESTAAPLKFSLAGVQLKLSMVREGRGLTLPMRGRDGDWIVKLPDGRFDGVPENEFVTMTWAKRLGLRVAETELVEVQTLEGLPVEFATKATGRALAVRRFDRPEPGVRVHMEDFAQVLGKYSADKYGATNYETLGRIILRVAGESAFEEFVRRLAFVVVSGNADAHIKNWSLLYPDGVHVELSPAYDLVSTIEFLPHDELALNLDGTKAWDRLSLDRFGSFARRVGASETRVRELVRDTATRALALWPGVRSELPVARALVEHLEAHWKKVPLLSS